MFELDVDVLVKDGVVLREAAEKELSEIRVELREREALRIEREGEALGFLK